jgi:Fungal specific transcription factor domain
MNSPRGGQGSPEITPEAEETSLRPASQPSIGDPLKVEKREDSWTYSVHSSHRQSSADSDENPMKRSKVYHPVTILNGNGNGHHTKSASPKRSPPSISRKESDLTILHWSTNPLDTDKDLVMELMRLYFLHHGASEAHCMFPERPFMLWFTNQCVPKSPDDLMLIYTMLAMATVFSSNPLYKERGKEFAAVGRYACDQRHYSLQLVQSRLLLALYYLANNSPNDTWDFCGAALRAATGMKLNLEIDKADIDGASEHPYNLHRDGYAECRRRTFWACYVLDKLNSFCSRQLSIINSEDVFLRLPCDAKSFEAQIEVNNPYFEPSSQIRDHVGTVGSLAYLINICSIWGDVMANIYRHFQRADDVDEDSRKLLSFHSANTVRLNEWSSSLPDWLSYSPENLARSIANGSLGSFITLHSLYHSAQMKLNRHLRPNALFQDQLERNIRTANEHAEALLLMADHLAARPRLQSNGEPSEFTVPFSAPFIGHAIISAVDIVTAKGYLSSLPSIPSKINGAMAVITELSTYWESAKHQRELINLRKVELVAGPAGWRSSYGMRDYVTVSRDGRQGDITVELDGEGPGSRANGRHHGGVLGTYEMQEPMEKMFARGNDCFYAVPLEVWDRALEKR